MEGILKQTVKDFSKASEVCQTIVIALLAFLVPTFLAQLLKVNNSQIIVGSIVNIALVVSALNLKGWNKLIPIITMPSISTILSGYVFKSASVFMVYMVPAIWIGNFILIFAFKYIMLEKRKSYVLASVVGVICKVTIIFGTFVILKSFDIFPEKVATNLQKAMSIVQFITATIGCMAGLIIYKIEKRWN